MNSSQYKSKQLKYLAFMLKCKPYEIEYICSHLQDYYGKRIETKPDKKTGKPKTYKDGTVKTRIIRPTYKRLKVIQTSIKLNILSDVELPPNVQGGVKKKSNITNGKKHQGNKYKFTIDLQEFYPSVSYVRVYSMFLRLGYSNHVARWLTKLTSKDFELPQGTPTSTHIANIVFLPIDKKLIQLCKENNITYTRYVDDLTFSSQKGFKHLLNNILGLVIDGGFEVSYRKTKYQGKQLITGIYPHNNYIDAPENIKEKAKKELESKSEVLPYNTYLNSIRRTNKNMKKKKLPTRKQHTLAGRSEQSSSQSQPKSVVGQP